MHITVHHDHILHSILFIHVQHSFLCFVAFFAVGGWGLVISNEGYVWMGGHMAHTCVLPSTSEPSVNMSGDVRYQTDADSTVQIVYLPSKGKLSAL